MQRKARMRTCVWHKRREASQRADLNLSTAQLATCRSQSSEERNDDEDAVISTATATERTERSGPDAGWKKIMRGSKQLVAEFARAKLGSRGKID